MSTSTPIIWNTVESETVSISQGEVVRSIIILNHEIQDTTLTFVLEGIHSQLDCTILILANHITIPLTINVVAKAPHTNARVCIRSLGKNGAKVMINGVLQSFEGTDEGVLHFSHHALHLTPDAHTKTIPSLEITADGVQAKHEVSLGYFDEHALWYGLSRGIDQELLCAEMAKGFMIQDLSETTLDALPLIDERINEFLVQA